MGSDDNKGSKCGICIIFPIFIMAIASLAMSSHLSSSHTCANVTAGEKMSSLESNVSLKNWLVISGSMGLLLCVSIVVVLISMACSEDTVCKVLLGVFGTSLVLSVIFNFAWNIVGSVLFWRDCLNKVPEAVNDYMFARLIISYVFGLNV